MVATLIDSVKVAKFLHLGYRSHSDNRWDRALDALEGGVVKRADGTGSGGTPAAATSPSSATPPRPSLRVPRSTHADVAQ